MRCIYRTFLAFRSVFFNPFVFVYRMIKLANDSRTQRVNNSFLLHMRDAYPCIADATKNTPIDPIYFFQDAWCASMVFSNKPSSHYDVGSNVHMLGILSQFVPVTMIDIRPLSVKLQGLKFIEGSIVSMPFEDASIQSLSSICVIEHIGLGRYGDVLDAFGSEKAALELVRVLAKGGRLYVSVPVDSKNKIYFNAHRAFTREKILDMFLGLRLVSEQYLYGKNLQQSYDATKGFGTGMFHFIRQ